MTVSKISAACWIFFVVMSIVIQEGEFAWEAPRVYKYGLRVTIPGRPPYETSCSSCARGIEQGSVVNIAVSRHNRKRVTIDLGQANRQGAAQPAAFS